MVTTVEQLKRISKATKFPPGVASNIVSIVVSLDKYGSQFGLDLPHRLAHYLAQLVHESGGYKYDREIWGNTPAQQRYDTRTDLGNTPAKDGDGKLYMGRTGIQLTGKANYTAFRDWVWRYIDKQAPDFVKEPDAVNTDPWEGLVPIWFWSVGNSTGKSLNTYADENDLETITKKINGGKNGLSDRLDYYTRAALQLCGPGYTLVDLVKDVKAFQSIYGLEVDGDAGPRTRAKLHEVLALKAKTAIQEDPQVQVKKAPVTEVEVVAAAPKEAAKPAKDLSVVTGIGVGTILTPLAPEALKQFPNLGTTVQVIILVMIGVGLAYLAFTRLNIARKTQAVLEQVQEGKESGLPS